MKPRQNVAPKFGTVQRLAYGAGELGPAMAGSTMIFFRLVFLTDVAGMNPGLAGSVLLLARIWDAVITPPSARRRKDHFCHGLCGWVRHLRLLSYS